MTTNLMSWVGIDRRKWSHLLLYPALQLLPSILRPLSTPKENVLRVID